MFPPFGLVGRVLAKVNRDKTEAVIVVPDWSTQYWYPQLMQMTSHEPLYFRPSAKNLILTHKSSTISKASVNGNQGNATTIKILESSLKQSTHCKYNNYWLDYSKTMGKIEVSHVLDFLSAMFEKGHAYSTISSAKRAIATIIHIPPYDSLNKCPFINKYMTGICMIFI